MRPEGVEVIGRVERSSFRRVWAPSRAVDLRRSLGLEGFAVVGRRCILGGKGLGSMVRRCPRSKMYDVGFVTVTGERSGGEAVIVSAAGSDEA